jgi:hypothetical protein
MAQYTGIQGQNILIVSSDPANPVEGQIWYNTTSNLLKGRTLTTTGAWATSGNMNQARDAIASAGTFTAGLAIGGGNPGGYQSYVEKYDGSVWTASTAYPVSRGYAAGTGTQTAAMVAGGNTYTPAVNFFNGSTWTSSTAAPAGLQAGNLVGTQAGAIYWGGGDGPGGYPSSAYLWTGSAWTASPSTNNSAKYGSMSTGTQTAALSAGGNSPLNANTEKWNGSAWTNSGALPFSGYNLGGNGVGTQSAAMVYGGDPNSTTQYFNGSTWSNQTATLTYPSPNKPASGGTQSAAFSASGEGTLATTNNWTGAGVAVTRTLTTS